MTSYEVGRLVIDRVQRVDAAARDVLEGMSLVRAAARHDVSRSAVARAIPRVRARMRAEAQS